MYYDCNSSHCRQFDYEINIMLVLCYVLNIALMYCNSTALGTVKPHKCTHLYISRLRTFGAFKILNLSENNETSKAGQRGNHQSATLSKCVSLCGVLCDVLTVLMNE